MANEFEDYMKKLYIPGKETIKNVYKAGIIPSISEGASIVSRGVNRALWGQGQQNAPQAAATTAQTPQIAAKPTATIPSAAMSGKLPYGQVQVPNTSGSSYANEMARATVVPPSARGITIEGVRQPSTGGETYPQVLEKMMSQQRQTGREVELGNVPGFVTPDVGVVRRAGTTNMGGWMPTNQAMSVLEAPKSPFKQGTAQEIEAAKQRYQAFLNSGKTLRETPVTQMSPYLAKERIRKEGEQTRISEAEKNRMTQQAVAESAAKGMIGKATAEQAGAERVAEISAGARGQKLTTDEQKNRINVLKAALNSENEDIRKKAEDELAAMIGGINISGAVDAQNAELEKAKAEARKAGKSKVRFGGIEYTV